MYGTPERSRFTMCFALALLAISIAILRGMLNAAISASPIYCPSSFFRLLIRRSASDG